jgi:hypothetical protein
VPNPAAVATCCDDSAKGIKCTLAVQACDSKDALFEDDHSWVFVGFSNLAYTSVAYRSCVNRESTNEWELEAMPMICKA